MFANVQGLAATSFIRLSLEYNAHMGSLALWSSLLSPYCKAAIDGCAGMGLSDARFSSQEETRPLSPILAFISK